MRVSPAAFSAGLRFGLLLQLAIGPVCLYVFRTGVLHGVAAGLLAVCGVALADALLIALAGLGVTRWAEDERARRFLQYGGAAVIALFALDVLGSAFGRPLLPSRVASTGTEATGSLLGAILLTLSNPLTIVFWAGVFGAKVAAERYGRRELWLFSGGCVAATVLFLTATALVGALAARGAPALVLRSLNVVVGCALLWFAARLLRRPAAAPADSAHPAVRR